MVELDFWDYKKLLKILPSYNILTDFRIGRIIKCFTFLSIKEISEAFKRYARSFSIEMVDKKDPLIQLNSSKPSIKDLFKDLLHEIDGFKYQNTINDTLSKETINGDTEYASVCFN